MATIIKFKNRLNSISSTKKITKAMELVASAKVGKARQKAIQAKFFRSVIYEAMFKIYQRKNEFSNSPYFTDNESNTTAYIIIGTDLGLCGAYNINILNKVKENIKDDNNYKLYVVGSKIIEKLKNESIKIHKGIKGVSENWTTDQISDLVISLIYDFKKNKINQIKLVYTKYISAIEQVSVCDDILPINIDEKFLKNEKSPIIAANTIVEPSVDVLFENIIPQYMISYIKTGYLESLASEYSHRRMSMENASKNAQELADSLTLKINRVRQANITQEISEIVSGSESQKG